MDVDDAESWRGMSGERARQARLLEYYRAIELFSPQTVPRADVNERVYDVARGALAPWENGHPERRRTIGPDLVRAHIVYGGLFELTAVRDVVAEVFGETGEDFDGRIRGTTALFAVMVTDEGKLLPGTLVVSTCGWATGRALRSGGRRGWLEGFDEDERDVRDLLAVFSLEPTPVDEGAAEESVAPPLTRTMDSSLLHEFADALADQWGVTKELAPAGHRVRTIVRSRKRAEEPVTDDFLNSFYLRDLARVAAAARNGDVGAALTTFLTPDAALDRSQRLDVRRHPGVVLDAVNPRRTPLGRWPSPPFEALALSQQFAVNSARSDLIGGGLFAVNGAPGTGKTTMLRDHVADRIVERARRLAALGRPSDAFGSEVRWQTAEWSRRVRKLIPELTGFEMVVASANNAAVENISIEIPERKSLGEQGETEADYFAEQATTLLDGKPAWGLIAARLGKQQYRKEFVNKLWFGTADGPSLVTLQDLLDEWIATPQTGVWTQAKQTFVAAHERVERLRDERVAAADAWSRREAAVQTADESQRAVSAASERLIGARAALEPLTVAVSQRSIEFEHAVARRKEHTTRRPGFWIILATFGRAARDWHREDAELGKRTYDAEAALVEARTIESHARSAAVSAEQELARCRTRQATALDTVRQLDAVLAAARKAWPGFVPTAEWSQDDNLRELSAPWADEEFCVARTELFLAALGLHHALIRCMAATMKSNLRAAMEVVSGQAPHDLPEEQRLAAWQSLFLVVPVVSTTFASLDRQFHGLGREALGWLFIDEAGQAAPQLAVGALWRAQRAIVVGDPLQLEPVVTLPWTAQQTLRAEFGVAQEWAPGRTSVQRIADRGMNLGTTLPAELPDGSHEVWVGAPLRVHRRCDPPMFDLSNAIAYDDMMVFGTPDRGPYAYRPGSCWIDVAGTASEGHWIPDEGQALRQVLLKIAETTDIDLNQSVFVISPFRAVVNGAKRAVRGLLNLDRVGTVHTAQGKEADVVILILGTARDRAGARSWAAERPNLLNVAVSRAKRRLFVIGDRTEWSKQRYFDVLGDAENLPSHPWRPAGAEQTTKG